MSSRPKLKLRKTGGLKVDNGQELLVLRKMNAEQAIAIDGLQKALLTVREEMKLMKIEHTKQLQFWTPVAHPFEKTRRFSKPKLL